MLSCLVTRTSLITAAALVTGCTADSLVSSRFGKIETCQSLEGGLDLDCDPLPGEETGITATTGDPGGTTSGDSSSGATADDSTGATSGGTWTTGEDTDATAGSTYGTTWGTTYDPTFGTWGTTYDSTDSGETNPDTISWTTITDPSGGSDSNTTDSTSTNGETSGETWTGGDTGGDGTDGSATEGGSWSGGDGSDTGDDGTDGGTWTAGETGGDEGGDDTSTSTSTSTSDDSGGDSSSGDDTGEPECDPNQNQGKKPCPNYWVKAPEVLSTAHIAKFNPTTVAGFLIKQEPWKTAAAELGGDYVDLFDLLIAGLALSANSDPPKSFSGGGVYGKTSGAWVLSKEYRGFMRIAPFKIHCDANTKKLAPKPCTDGSKLSDFHEDAASTIDHGWTKEPGLGFSKGEPRTAVPGGTPAPGSTKEITKGDRNGKNTDTCVTYTAYFAARIANPARTAQAVVTQFDAPFIWQDLKSTVCCDGTYDVHMTRSVFPTSSLYVNMDQVAIGGQYRLGDFMRSGGGPPPVNPPGEGFKAPAATDPLTASGNARKIDACDGSVTQQYTPAPTVLPP